MNGEDIFRELGYIDPQLIISAQPKEFSITSDKAPCEPSDGRKEKTKKSFARFERWASIAACFCIVAVITIMFKSGVFFGYKASVENDAEYDKSNTQTPDIVYGAYFNNLFYQPFSQLSSDAKAIWIEKLPELSDWEDGTLSDGIARKTVGEYIGVFPAIEDLELSKGKAYRHAAYPDSEAIIIVERRSEYFLYFTDGNTLYALADNSSDTVIERLDLFDSIVSFEISGTEIKSDNELAFNLCEILAGKQAVSANEVDDEIRNAYLAENDDGSVWLDDGKLCFEDNEARSRYAEYYSRSLYSVIISTAQGLSPILRFDTEFDYIQLCGIYYRISEAESERLAELFGV